VDNWENPVLAGQDRAAIGEERRPEVVGTTLRDAVGMRGAASAHDVVLAVVAVPDVVSLSRLHTSSHVAGRCWRLEPADHQAPRGQPVLSP
jgi:hypothetical protein